MITDELNVHHDAKCFRSPAIGGGKYPVVIKNFYINGEVGGWLLRLDAFSPGDGRQRDQRNGQ